MRVIKYKHHREWVSVREDLKGKHKEHCLCYEKCVYFFPGEPKYNCSVAQSVFDLCVTQDLVLPVWECPDYTTEKILEKERDGKEINTT